MKLKDHIERFEESLLDEKVSKPVSKDIGMLTEHIARFEESLGESPTIKSTSKEVIFSHVEQLQLEIRNKDKIIESLKSKSTELTDEVLNLEKEKSFILEELNNSKWLENNIASNTKKIYEDKIKRMSYVDSTKLIPTLIEVSRKKQGNEILNWGKWLEIPENKYLFQINEDMAKKVFQDTTDLIKRYISNINDPLRSELIEAGRTSRTRGGSVPTYTNNSSITFTGDGTFGNEGTGDYVDTGFDPIEHELYNGFTVSYWVRPDEIGDRMFALGVYGNGSNERFTFGIRSAGNIFVGIGSTRKQENAAHGMEVGQWYHWVFTYSGHTGTAAGVCDADCRWLRVYKNGQPVQISPEGDFEGGIYVSHNRDYAGRTGGHSLFLGGRNNRVRSGGAGYDNGWACGLDEVAIYNEMKDSDPADYTSGDVPSWVTETYNNGVPTDLTGQSGLVAYWRFEDNAVTDYSVNNNHGTLTTNDTGLPTFSSDTPGG